LSDELDYLVERSFGYSVDFINSVSTGQQRDVTVSFGQFQIVESTQCTYLVHVHLGLFHVLLVVGIPLEAFQLFQRIVLQKRIGGTDGGIIVAPYIVYGVERTPVAVIDVVHAVAVPCVYGIVGCRIPYSTADGAVILRQLGINVGCKA